MISPQPLTTEGFAGILSRHPDRFQLVTSTTWRDQLDEEQEPDVVLYDVLGLVHGDGSDLDYLVKETGSAVFAVGRDLRPALLSQALEQGVDGFFSEDVTEDELLAAIDSAMTGWLPGDDGPDPVVGSSTSAQRAQHLGTDLGLSKRESQVLALVAQGLGNDEIADRLFLSINSVKSYIRTAYRKIGVTTRSQAAVWAIEHGFTVHRGEA
ncbi:DNA-binding response regulator [Nocardioides hankookensis]|uniref:DNA-binding response regulator n=1 Tax=Nocardioides hankookensis TaxID=443157 RepID=A0ABW1LHP6_9ACTN